MFKKLFYNKTNNTVIQLFRYFFVGGASAVVDISSFGIFSEILGIDYRIAVFFSFTLGTFTNFILSNKFIFERKSLKIITACFRHYLSSIGGLIVNEIAMITLVEFINSEYMIINKIIATICGFFINFFLIKYFAFNDKINFNIISREGDKNE